LLFSLRQNNRLILDLLRWPDTAVEVVEADTVEVVTVEAVVADEVVSSSSQPILNPVPLADGTNKDVGRRFHLI
jgi:hypothetical protein